MADDNSSSDFVLVPRVPTKAMLNEAYEYAHAEDATGVWRSMIEAWLEESKGHAQAH